MSSAYLKLLIFLLAMLIPASDIKSIYVIKCIISYCIPHPAAHISSLIGLLIEPDSGSDLVSLAL